MATDFSKYEVKDFSKYEVKSDPSKGGRVIPKDATKAERRALANKSYGKMTDTAITAGEIAAGFAPLPISTGAMAIGEGGRSLLRGEGIGKAWEKGARAAAINMALFGAGALATKGAGAAGKFLVKGKVPNQALNRAIENPNLFSEGQQKVMQVGPQIASTADDFAKAAEKKFGAVLDNVTTKKQVSMQGVRALMTKEGWDANTRAALASSLKAEAKRNFIPVSDATIDKFAGTYTPPSKALIKFMEENAPKSVGALQNMSLTASTKALTFDESRTLNRLLFNILKDQPTDAIGRGAKAPLQALKTSLLDSMERTAPGIRETYKDYNKSVALYKGVREAILNSKDEINEGALKNLALEALGVGKNKSVDLDKIKMLQAATGKQITEDLKDAMARELIDKGGPSAFSRLAGMGAGGAAGSVMGPFGTAGGLISGLGASQVLGNPEVTKAALTYGPSIPKALRYVTTPARQIASQSDPLKIFKK